MAGAHRGGGSAVEVERVSSARASAGRGGGPGAPIYRRGWSGGGAGVMVAGPIAAGDAQRGQGPTGRGGRGRIRQVGTTCRRLRDEGEEGAAWCG